MAANFKVLFVYPNLRGMNMLPPAIAILSRLVEDEGYEVDLFDTTYYKDADVVDTDDSDFSSDKVKEQNLNVLPYDMTSVGVEERTGVYDDFARKVESFQPDLLAVSATEDMFLLGIRMLRRVRHLKVPTILGGVFSTFAPELALSYPEIDMICIGEGEHCLVQLCRKMANGDDYSGVTNLWSKARDGSIVRTGMSDPIDVNATPLPNIGIFDKWRLYRPMAGQVYRMLPVETHRGCPYTCAFCNSPGKVDLYREQTGKNFFRKKSFEKIREEIRFYIDNWDVEYLYFWADTFLAWTSKEFDEFCDMYSEFKLPFWCQTRPETVNDYNIKRLKEVGLHRLSFGIEHGNEKFRSETISRHFANDRIIEALKVPKQYDVSFSVNNIIGFPHETRELAEDTIRLNRQIDADNFNCYAFSPFHGTPLRREAERLGLIDPDKITMSLTRGSILDLPGFSKEQILGMMRTFVMYVKFPESRFPEIRKAEAFTPQGDKIWNKLREEYIEEFYETDEVTMGIEEAAMN